MPLSTYRKPFWLALIMAVGLIAALGGQGQVMPPPKFTAYDSNGDPCAGCKLYTYAAGTTTPQNTYTSSTLGTPNANPVVLDSAGRATVFLDPALSYKFVLKTAADVDIWTVDAVVGPFAGVVTISAGNTRGLQVTRSGAESGLSIASTGGSGKTWGLASTTSGELKIQDEADGSPRLQLGSGDNASLVTTGTFTLSGGLMAITGNAGLNTVAATRNEVLGWRVTNSSAGTAAYSAMELNNSTATTTRLLHMSSGFTPASWYLADGGVLHGSGAGGISIAAAHASGDIRFYSGGNSTARLTLDDTGVLSTLGVRPATTGVSALGSDSLRYTHLYLTHAIWLGAAGITQGAATPVGAECTQPGLVAYFDDNTIQGHLYLCARNGGPTTYTWKQLD